MAVDSCTYSLSSRLAPRPSRPQPDFNDSSLDSWEPGRYVPPPPFVPLYNTYKEQTMAHLNAYPRTLGHRTDATLSRYYQVYSKP